MQFWHAFPSCVVAVFLAGCVTTPTQNFAPPNDYVPLDRIQIQNQFQVVDVDAANLAIEAHRCVPQLNAESKNVAQQAGKLPLPRNTFLALGHASSASMLFIARSTATCIRQSTARYPIFAGEAFEVTVNPKGVPPNVTEGWYAQLAMRIAENGRVTVAYVFPNGNADIASYWVTSPNKNTLNYSNEFKKAGTWETGTYDYRFTNPGLAGVSTTKRGSSMEKPNLLDGQMN